MSGTSSDIVLQARDTAILLGLFESRVMTRRHIAALYFEGREEAAKKRLQKLLAAKLIAERARRRYEPSILYLARRGHDALEAAGLLSDYPHDGWTSFAKRVQVSEATMRHELEVMSIKAAFVQAVRTQPALKVAEFSTWPRLYEFRANRPDIKNGWPSGRSLLMKPDGFIRLHQTEAGGVAEHCFFLELDRGTETLDTVASKADGYRNYYRSGDFARRMNCDPAHPERCPFRCLLVAQSKKRCENIAQKLLEMVPPIRTQVWLGVLAEVLAQPLGEVWGWPGENLTDFSCRLLLDK